MSLTTRAHKHLMQIANTCHKKYEGSLIKCNESTILLQTRPKKQKQKCFMFWTILNWRKIQFVKAKDQRKYYTYTQIEIN